MMCWVWINYRAEIWRILSNIMDNAIKFSQAGSVLMVGVKEEFLPLTVTRSKFLCVTDNSAANSLSFFFIPDGYSKRFVFKAPMVWNPCTAKVLIIFQKRTNSHKENRTVPEELALEYDLHKPNFLNWLYMNAEWCIVFAGDTFFRECCKCWFGHFHYTTQSNSRCLSLCKITNLLIYR